MSYLTIDAPGVDVNVARELVRAILERATSYQWTVQGFGMMRLYLRKVGRIHVWDSRLRVRDVSDMHTHPWSLRSTIIAGTLVNERYATIPDTLPPNFAAELAQGQIDEYYEQLLQTGEGGGLKGEPNVVRVRRMSQEVYRPGDVYSQGPAEIHVSKPEDGCVTLMERPKGPDYTEHAWVYWPRDRGQFGWTSAEPRVARDVEVAAAVALALTRWDS